MADLEFRLDVIENGDTWTVICECPQGRRVCEVPAPFSAEQLRGRLRDIEMSLIRSTSPTVTRRSARPEHTFGRELSRTLLADDIRVLFALCREKAREQGERMRLLLNPIGPNVCRVPWELTTDPDAEDEYLALRMPVARSPHLIEPVSPLRITPPLRILGVLSRPRDLPQLEADREREIVTGALRQLRSDVVQIEWLDTDRWQTLRSRLQAEPWHILHFIGHGGFDTDLQSGYLELTDEDGDALRVQASDVAGFVRDNPALKLVVLNACESAATGDDGVFSSTAAKLMRAGVPAVVAMQYEITDPAALAFSYSFYEAIARGIPVDRAVTHAREEVKITTGSLEWVTPVLFLASPETRIFDVPPARIEPSAPQAGEPRPPGDPTHPRPPSTAPAGHPVADRAPVDWKSLTRGQLLLLMNRISDASSSRRPPPGPAPVPESAAAASGGSSGVPPGSAATRSSGAGTTTAGAAAGAGTVRSLRPGLDRQWISPPYGRCTFARFGPEGLLALACPDGLRVVSLTRRREVARCSLPRSGPPVRLAWSPWPRTLVTVDGRGEVVVWDLASETPLHVVRPHGAATAVQVAFSHRGTWLAVACSDLSVHVFNHAGAEVRSLQLPPSQAGPATWRVPMRAVTTLAFSADDRHLIIGGDDGTLRQYDVRGELVRNWPHTHAVSGFAATDSVLATSCADGRLRTWSWEGTMIRAIDAPPAEHLAMSPAGGALAAIAEATCTVWGRTGERIGSAMLQARGTGLCLSPVDGLITVGVSGVIESWAVPPGGEVWE